MYTVTSTGRDSYGAEVVIITCQACRYIEEHFIDQAWRKRGGYLRLIWTRHQTSLPNPWAVSFS